VAVSAPSASVYAISRPRVSYALVIVPAVGELVVTGRPVVLS